MLENPQTAVCVRAWCAAILANRADHARRGCDHGATGIAAQPVARLPIVLWRRGDTDVFACELFDGRVQLRSLSDDVCHGISSYRPSSAPSGVLRPCSDHQPPPRAEWFHPLLLFD